MEVIRDVLASPIVESEPGKTTKLVASWIFHVTKEVELRAAHRLVSALVGNRNVREHVSFAYSPSVYNSVCNAATRYFRQNRWNEGFLKLGFQPLRPYRARRRENSDTSFHLELSFIKAHFDETSPKMSRVKAIASKTLSDHSLRSLNFAQFLQRDDKIFRTM